MHWKTLTISTLLIEVLGILVRVERRRRPRRSLRRKEMKQKLKRKQP